MLGGLDSNKTSFRKRHFPDLVDEADEVGSNRVDLKVFKLLKKCVNDRGFVRIDNGLSIARRRPQ